MAEITLTAVPASGSDITIGANRIVDRADLALVSIAVPLGGDVAARAALKDGWGLAWPEPGNSTEADNTRAIWTAPDQILLLFPHAEPDANVSVQARLGDAGYTTDQTDVWVMLDVSGPDTLAALERIVPLDLHPDRFTVGCAARTVTEHMGALILRLDDDHFLLLSARSSAASFLHAVETSYINVQA